MVYKVNVQGNKLKNADGSDYVLADNHIVRGKKIYQVMDDSSECLRLSFSHNDFEVIEE